MSPRDERLVLPMCRVLYLDGAMRSRGRDKDSPLHKTPAIIKDKVEIIPSTWPGPTIRAEERCSCVVARLKTQNLVTYECCNSRAGGLVWFSRGLRP